MMKLYILLVFFLGISVGFAQQGQDYLKLIRENYMSINNLSVQLDYELYKGIEGKKAIQSYSSEYRKSGQNQYRKIDQIELINIDSFSLNINHSNQTILLSKHKPINYFEFDLKQSLKYCERVSVQTIKGGFIVSLIIKASTNLPISKIEFRINNKYWIEETEIYYSNKINFSNSYFKTDMDYPKLLVRYQPIDQNWEDKIGLLSMKSYITFTNNKPFLNSTYSGYKLVDGRR